MYQVGIAIADVMGGAGLSSIEEHGRVGPDINPRTARSQILGGIVMGLGMALHEEGMIDHRSGRIMNHNIAEYHMPTHADVEDIEVLFVEEEDDKVSPIGVKGVGEIGIAGVAAAISNAIFHATGKRIRHFPSPSIRSCKTK